MPSVRARLSLGTKIMTRRSERHSTNFIDSWSGHLLYWMFQVRSNLQQMRRYYHLGLVCVGVARRHHCFLELCSGTHRSYWTCANAFSRRSSFPLVDELYSLYRQKRFRKPYYEPKALKNWVSYDRCHEKTESPSTFYQIETVLRLM